MSEKCKKETEENFDEYIDCTGLYCPAPIYETRKKIDTMEKGHILKITADDPGSGPDIRSWARMTGNELVKAVKNNNIFTFYIRKTG